MFMKVVKKTIYHFEIYFIKPYLKIRDAGGFALKGGVVNASMAGNSTDMEIDKRRKNYGKNEG